MGKFLFFVRISRVVAAAISVKGMWLLYVPWDSVRDGA